MLDTTGQPYTRVTQIDPTTGLPASVSGASYVLLNNSTGTPANGTQTAKVRQARYGFTVENYGTGTATVSVQQLGADGTTWVPSKDSGGNAITFTVAARGTYTDPVTGTTAPSPSSQTKVYDVMQDSILRAVVSGVSGSVSIYMTMG